ncbi:MAG: squalene synthase HpnC [Jatrophihabitans endophyticus]|nr:squalene synthase HpnC [Jatrophihabitans endophyticus]
MGDENFPVALRLLPRAVAADLGAVYRYARFVDDVGDDHAVEPATRLERLDVIERDVRSLADGGAVLPPVTGLAPLVDEHGVPLATLLDLVEANRVDQRVAAYETFADLLDYCALSAAPVGRIVLHRAHAATDDNVADSDSVCDALQVLEHCQDVGEDAAAGRTYLPAVELRRAGVEPADLRAARTSPALRRVVAVQVARSRALLRNGRPLVSRLSGWARVAVAGYVAGGLATADALQAADFGVLEAAVTPGTTRTTWHALRLLGRRA